MGVLGVYLEIRNSLETKLSQNKSPISLKIKGFSETSKRPGDRARLSGGGCSQPRTRLPQNPC